MTLYCYACDKHVEFAPGAVCDARENLLDDEKCPVFDADRDDIQTHFPHPTNKSPMAAVWPDKNGIFHRAVGANVGQGRDYILLLWTACGKKDIPANSAQLASANDVTCPACKEVQHGDF